MRRRDFIKIGSVLAGATAQQGGYAAPVNSWKKTEASPAIDFLHDGLSFSPQEYAALLMKLADEGKIRADYYSNGGVVEELENKFAQLFGKESAVFMPTGTLANHIAVRNLANNNRRILVQEQSHLYNDTGDCSQTLSALNLIPLGENSVEFTLAQIESIVKKTKGGRVESRIGAISIETPVRRQQDRMFDDGNIKAISAYAKNNGIKMHLDGARIFVQCVHTKTTPAQYGEMFDTAYTSLWKCFNAASGAVLAGSKKFTENLFHERRMFGGSLPAAWAFAAVALHFSDGFIDEYSRAWANAEKFFSLIKKQEKTEVIMLDKGSHIVRVNIKNTNLKKLVQYLAKQNITLPDPDATGFLLKVNPSINRDTPENLAQHFADALRG
jgi:threonine aldolase